MDKTPHPAATPHLPGFITAPGDTDVLMIVTALVLLGAVIAFGVGFLVLHTLPERMAHKSHKLQFEIVAVLGLLALFTHMHIFWVIGLILALIDFPDLGGWLSRIAGSVEKIADNSASRGPAERPGDGGADARRREHAADPAPESGTGDRRSDGTAAPGSELTPRGAVG